MKAKYVVGSDGSRIYRRKILWDSKLAVDCSFRLASDGMLRCLPMVPDLDILAGNWGQVFFTDTECKNAFLWFVPPPSGCTASLPPYVYDYDALPFCGLPAGTLPSARVYSVGAAMARPAGTIYAYNGNTCSPEQGGLQGNRTAYSLGAEVDPGSFVAGTRKVAP